MDVKRYGRPNSAEPLSDQPVELPLGATQPTPLHVLVARMVREHVAAERDEAVPSIEEEDDFEEEDPDTLDFSSQYDLSEVTEEPISSSVLSDPPDEEIDSALSEALSEAPQETPAASPDPNDVGGE